MITILGPLFLFGCYVALVSCLDRAEKRARFFAVGLPVLAWGLLYTPCARALTGHG